MTRCMIASRAGRRGTNNPPPWLVHDQTVKYPLHSAQLRSDLLAQGVVVPQGPGIDAANDPLRSFHQLIELLVGADIELPEALEEIRQVEDRRVPEDLAFAGAI